jgi:hypothetical protein
MTKRKSSSSIASKSPKSTRANSHDSPFQAAHILEYGLEITQRHPKTLAVLGVRCNFCVFFGHELLDGQERSRKQSQNVKSWTAFRAEYYRDHHLGQHSTQWKGYKMLNMEEKEQYFAGRIKVKDTIPHHFQQGDIHHTYRVDATIVDIVLGISSSF